MRTTVRTCAAVAIALFAAAVAIALPRDVNAQSARRRISVHVSDSAGVPISNVVVDALSENDSTMASGRTDSAGVGQLSIASNRRRLTIRARKVGYQPFESTFDLTAAGPALLRLVLTRSIQQLGPVQTTESETLLRKRYHIDADAIAASGAVLIDGFDVIAKLRPDIVWGRGDCGGAANIWVNGRWIPPELLLQNDIANARAKSGGASSKVSRAVLYALTMIPPQDIAELTYLDCRDTSLEGLHSRNALFVVLKDGLRFDPGAGVKRIAATVANDSARNRASPSLILGVFDGDTGVPIVDAVVRDSVSGASALTTATGTVSLAFLEPQDSIVAIHKLGFRDTVFVVSKARTTPITIVLKRN